MSNWLLFTAAVIGAQIYIGLWASIHREIALDEKFKQMGWFSKICMGLLTFMMLPTVLAFLRAPRIN